MVAPQGKAPDGAAMIPGPRYDISIEFCLSLATCRVRDIRRLKDESCKGRGDDVGARRAIAFVRIDVRVRG
jgi:hypothetical protein